MAAGLDSAVTGVAHCRRTPQTFQRVMTAARTQITDKVVQDSITKAVQSVFRTMMHRDATLVSNLQAEALNGSFPATQVLASVGFLGVIDGLIYLCVSEEFARTMSGQMLGMSAAEIAAGGNEVVNDAIGEITNMTVGGFKNTLCDMGFPCKLTVPAIVRGNNLSVAAIKSSTRHVFQFDCSGQRLVADIQIKVD
jgi:chemotaxis protein CheX